MYKLGRSYAVQSGRGKPGLFTIKVIDLKYEFLGEISEEDVKAEGYETKEEFINSWREINKSYNPRQAVTVIKFEIEN